MCGIIFGANAPTPKKKKWTPINEFIIHQFENQFNRGQKGFGIVAIQPDGSFVVDRACEPYKFLLDLYLPDKAAPFILAHHRTPTSTDNTLDQTHPILVSNVLLKYDYLVVHNGMIINDDELKKIHEELGFNYNTAYSSIGYNTETIEFNDSEAIAIEFALFIEKKIPEIRTTSRAALVALQINKETGKAIKVFFGRNNGDLQMYQRKGILRIASENIGVDDADIANNTLHSFRLSDPKLKIKESPLLFKEEPVSKVVGFLPKSVTETVTKTGQQTTETNTQHILPDYFSDKTMIDGVDKVSGHYPDTCATNFNEMAKGLSLEETLETFDSCLYTEVTAINDLLNGYKDALMEGFPNKGDMSFIIGQIAIRVRAMDQISHCAETEKKVSEEMEDLEEVGITPTAADIEEARAYNKSFDLHDPRDYDDSDNYYGRGFGRGRFLNG